MHTPRPRLALLGLALLGLTSGCGGDPPARSSVAGPAPAASPAPSPGAAASAAAPPTADGDVASSDAQTSPPGEAGVLPDPWGRAKDIRSAVGGGHYAKGVAGGQKYRVKDARTGEQVSVGIPLIVMDGEQPRAYPTAAHTGHVIFKARSRGDEVLLDYALHWDPSAARSDGSTGGFMVDSVVLIQRGDAPPAARFVRDGAWWRRDVADAAPAPATAEDPPPVPG